MEQFTEQEKKKQTFTVNTEEYPYDRLSSYAKRILILLEHPAIEASDELKSTLDELLGSIHSLMLARKLDFEDRIKKKKEDAVILGRAKDLSQGVIRIDGKWAAGYYMNSSTYRTSAAYNRLLKILTGIQTDDVKELLPAAGKAYREWTGGKQWSRNEIEKVREEANSLKHNDDGLYLGRGLWQQNAVVAIGQLVTFVEAWLARGKQIRK